MALVAGTDLDQYVAHLATDPRAVHVERLPARAARHGELARPLPESVADRLGVGRLWSHQAQAIDLVREGRSVAVATGTASGKSLCYQAPIAEVVAEGLRPATALLVFPTKALAQDQLRSLVAMDIPRMVAATYDGDAGPEQRTWVRRHANVLLTNPDMLHHGILPHHDRWSTFLMRLRYVVVDELHLLRGVFGSHVAHLLRRLRRLCAHYGSDPTFVFSSATIGRPGELASALCGLDVTAVTDDGSPRGERLFVLWNPAVLDELDADLDEAHLARTPVVPVEGDGVVADDGPPWPDADAGDSMAAPADDETDDPAEDGAGGPRFRRWSANRETAALMADLVRAGRRTIAFCRSRKGTELVAADVGRRLGGELADLVRPYRAGYLTDERRQIEAELFDGRLRGVVATTALELGVDIGGLDACVLNGFPGTIASLWQQAGRAGREQQESLALLVAGDDQLDQWLMHHPTEVFTREPEPAVINPTNPFVLHPHIACAAYELPLRHTDERWWPDLLDDAVRDLVGADLLKLRAPRRGRTPEPLAVWSGRGWPADRIGLRGNDGGEVRIARADGTIVGTVDRGRACRQVHPGATYLHRGRPYRVLELDLEDGAAIVEPATGDDYTQPRSETDITILATDASRPLGTTALGLGTVRVVSRVVGYKRFEVASGELLEVAELYLPPSELVTRGFWFTTPPELLAGAGIAPADWPGALHAAEHAAIGMLPLFTICDRWDVGGVSTPLQADTGLPTIVVHDAYPGGAGIAELGFEAADRLLDATLDAVGACGCADGCPSCIQSPKCGNGNEPLHKAGAVALLRAVLDR